MRAEDQAAAFQGSPGWTAPPQSGALPATQQAQALQPAGVGGPGWNEDFDQAWAQRMMKQYGVTMEDLRDPATRRYLNRQQAAQRAVPPGTGGIDPAQKPASSNVVPQTPGQYGGINPGGNTYPQKETPSVGGLPSTPGQYGGINPGANGVSGGGPVQNPAGLQGQQSVLRRRLGEYGPAQQGGGGLV